MTLIHLNRIKRVLFLDRKVYSEIVKDKDALIQAIIVVLLTSVISEIWFISGYWTFFFILILTLAGWFMETGAMHILAKLLGGKANFVSYLKAIGFARVPGVLTVIPSHISWTIGLIWVFACYFTATAVVHRLSPDNARIVAVVPLILVGLVLWMSFNIYSWMGLGTTEADLFRAAILTSLSFSSLL